MKALSLFSGIGGIDLAAEWAGIETVAFCEREPFCQKVLAKHWPNIPIYDDVCTLTKERFESDGIGTIELIHGGYPCQPFSNAGNRKGAEDDRHLWPEVFRLIQTIKPRWFVGENVAGHVTLGLDIVLVDLESIGYSWEAFIVPAAAVNALHRRDRIFIVAYADGIGNNGKGKHRIDREWQKEMQERFESFLGSGDESQNVSDSTSEGLPIWRRSKLASSNSETPTGMEPKSKRCSADVAYTNSERELQPQGSISKIGGWIGYGGESDGQRQWTVEPGVGRVATRIPHRVDRLKALGNAVVPQQIYPILAAIKQIDDVLKAEGHRFDRITQP